MLRLVVAAVAAASVSACALSEDKVAVDYVPIEVAAQVQGANSVTVSIAGADSRAQYRDRISTKKNGYGMEMARIVATNDVVDLVRGAVEREFKAQGFAIGEGGLAVSVELQNFYNNFKVGVFSGIAAAEVAFALKVRNAKGDLLYSRFYDETGTVEGIMLASGTNAKEALEKALAAALRKVVADQGLQQALLSSKPAAPARRSGASS